MKDVFFWFIIDSSGSMAGQKTSAVNAAVKECLVSLRQSDGSGSAAFHVGFCLFDEHVRLTAELVRAADAEPQELVLSPGADGFYALTSYKALYTELNLLMTRFRERMKGKQVFLFLVTDGKAADPGEYTAAMRKCLGSEIVGSAARYVILTEPDVPSDRKEAGEFVSPDTGQILNLEQFSDTVSMLALALST